MKYQIMSIAALIVLAIGSASLHGAGAFATDNSRENAVLTKAAARTAQDQPNDRDDRTTVARIRRAILADDSLSIYAQNVKIIVAGGRVTLEGPVHSDDERQEIVFDVANIVAPNQVDNRITVG